MPGEVENVRLLVGLREPRGGRLQWKHGLGLAPHPFSDSTSPTVSRRNFVLRQKCGFRSIEVLLSVPYNATILWIEVRAHGEAV